MHVNCPYSYPYLNQQKPLFLPIIAYTLSSTKLAIRGDRGGRVGDKGGGGGRGEK
jgi:hypothetical protein